MLSQCLYGSQMSENVVMLSQCLHGSQTSESVVMLSQCLPGRRHKFRARKLLISLRRLSSSLQIWPRFGTKFLSLINLRNTPKGVQIVSQFLQFRRHKAVESNSPNQYRSNSFIFTNMTGTWNKKTQIKAHRPDWGNVSLDRLSLHVQKIINFLKLLPKTWHAPSTKDDETYVLEWKYIHYSTEKLSFSINLNFLIVQPYRDVIRKFIIKYDVIIILIRWRHRDAIIPSYRDVLNTSLWRHEYVPRWRRRHGNTVTYRGCRESSFWNTAEQIRQNRPNIKQKFPNNKKQKTFNYQEYINTSIYQYINT